MTDQCGYGFEQTLLSGYLDGMLTQGDAQRVQVHLDDCEHCRATLSDMRGLREATMGAAFDVPNDDQWLELPRGPASRLSMTVGWSMVIVWLVALAGYGAWEYARSDEPLMIKVVTVAGWSGFGLLLLGVALDRWKAMKTDRYREVER